jgi:hypothetical protein
VPFLIMGRVTYLHHYVSTSQIVNRSRADDSCRRCGSRSSSSGTSSTCSSSTLADPPVPG